MRREWKDGRSVQQRNSRNPEVILLLIFFELLNHLRGQAQLGVGASGRRGAPAGRAVQCLPKTLTGSTSDMITMTPHSLLLETSQDAEHSSSRATGRGSDEASSGVATRGSGGRAGRREGRGARELEVISWRNRIKSAGAGNGLHSGTAGNPGLTFSRRQTQIRLKPINFLCFFPCCPSFLNPRPGQTTGRKHRCIFVTPSIPTAVVFMILKKGDNLKVQLSRLGDL